MLGYRFAGGDVDRNLGDTSTPEGHVSPEAGISLSSLCPLKESAVKDAGEGRDDGRQGCDDGERVQLTPRLGRWGDQPAVAQCYGQAARGLGTGPPREPVHQTRRDAQPD